MRTTKSNRLVSLFLLALVVFLFMYHASPKNITICEKPAPSLREAPGAQFLWESLSRQFVSVKAY